MIPQRNLSLLSNRLARAGGRRVTEAVLERDYCLAWFLVGLSRAPLRTTLVFKGGTALKRCYFGDYRFSEDLDFTLAAPHDLDAILSGLQEVYAEVQRSSGIAFRFSRADRKSHHNSHTFYLAYEGPLPAASLKEVKVDITLREQLVRPVEDHPVLRGYEEYSDLPEDAGTGAIAPNSSEFRKRANRGRERRYRECDQPFHRSHYSSFASWWSLAKWNAGRYTSVIPQK